MKASVVIGHATLYLARCQDVLPDLGGDLDVAMDPPYLLKTSGGGKFRAARPCLDQIEAAGLDEGFDVELITKAQFRSLACFCHNDQLHILTSHLQAEFGRYVVCHWDKTNPIPVANKHLMPDSEPWVRTWQGEGYPQGPLKKRSRFWIGQNGRQDVYKHPTVKPIQLMRDIIQTMPGETITDLFMGTGTTCAAALIEGRKTIGIEKNPEFFAMAVDRVKRIYADGLARIPLGEVVP